MRRISVAALFASVACGGKPTVTATPEIKAGATKAQQSLGDASRNTQAAVGLQVITTMAAATVTGSNIGVDLRGLPSPDGLSDAADGLPTAPPATRALRSSVRSSAATIPVSGCVRSDASGLPVWIQPGVDGCGAFDHLEFDYDDGEVVNLTYSAATDSFDLALTIVSGPWTGTHFRYAGSWDADTTENVSADGTLAYSSPSEVIDSDFSTAYKLLYSHTPTSDAATLTVNGTVTDQAAQVRATESWVMSAAAQSSAQFGSRETVDWTGSMDIAPLAADGQAAAHSVRFDGLTVKASWIGVGATTYSAGGGVEWDRALCGSMAAETVSVYVKWTDGTQSPFDPSALLGWFGTF